MTMPIKYVKGDATQPIEVKEAWWWQYGEIPHHTKVIVHICNDIGVWGAGFVKAISARWPEPEQAYRRWSRGDNRESEPFELGRVQFVRYVNKQWPVDAEAGGEIVVANMIAQRGVVNEFNPKPLKEFWLKLALKKIALMYTPLGTSIHMPRIGCGLAGGEWKDVEPIIQEAMPHHYVVVYDLE
jgi:O-acetyl-ADP-ribose deacetylase (regulator of RNase III)